MTSKSDYDNIDKLSKTVNLELFRKEKKEKNNQKKQLTKKKRCAKLIKLSTRVDRIEKANEP